MKRLLFDTDCLAIHQPHTVHDLRPPQAWAVAVQ